MTQSPSESGIEVPTLAAPIIKATLEYAFKSVVDLAGQVLKNAFSKFRISSKKYLEGSYERCVTFKTILDPNCPLNVIQNYTHVDLMVGTDRKFSDDDMIASIPALKRIVISGLAGSGKSMLMKYLTIAHFENPQKGIPLFVELRHINTYKEKNLLTFIRVSSSIGTHAVSAEEFDSLLQSDRFVLVLDGFDEVNYDARDEVQKQILDLERAFPNLSIILSSRPDDRFGSWSSYTVFRVRELTKSQALTLLRRIPYDKGLKARFVKAVNATLYERHTTFMSSPLLATIMMLTYEQYADIPAKMHVFYSHAFDTLFQKHDATKDQFLRKTRSGLLREEFKECFSAFCAMSYLDQKFSFSNDSLFQTAKSAIKYCVTSNEEFPKKVKPADFLSDLHQVVCMLQPDGLETSFVHRSFQEYFTAAFTVSITGENFHELLDRLSFRYYDSVIEMTRDLNRQMVEQDWIMPTVKHLLDALSLTQHELSTGNVASFFMPVVALQKIANGVYWLSSERSLLYCQLQAICKLYPSNFVEMQALSYFRHLNGKKLKSLLSEPGSKDRKSYDLLEKISKAPDREPNGSPSVVFVQLGEGDDWWLNAIGYGEALKSAKISLEAIRGNLDIKGEKQESMMRFFLSPPTKRKTRTVK